MRHDPLPAALPELTRDEKLAEIRRIFSEMFASEASRTAELLIRTMEQRVANAGSAEEIADYALYTELKPELERMMKLESDSKGE